jgi:hypothetical protein
MLRKSCLIALATAALALPGYGATISADAYNLRFDMETDFDSDAYEFPPCNASIGYFPVDNFEVGGLIGLRKADWNSYWVTGSVWELGLFAEKHFDLKQDFNFHPLLGLRASLLDGEEDSDTAYQAFLYAGGKIFMTQNAAIVINAGVTAATEDIYNVDTTLNQDLTTTQSGDAVGLLVDVGLRYYF